MRFSHLLQLDYPGISPIDAKQLAVAELADEVITKFLLLQRYQSCVASVSCLGHSGKNHGDTCFPVSVHNIRFREWVNLENYIY